MVFDVTFSGMPFLPTHRQVIYVEQDHNAKISNFILRHYDWIKDSFRQYDLDFCFLPLLANEVISYNAPFLSAKEKNDCIASVPSLATFLTRCNTTKPILVFANGASKAKSSITLSAIEIKHNWFRSLKATFSSLAKEISNSQCAMHKPITPIAPVFSPNIIGSNIGSAHSTMPAPADTDVQFSIRKFTTDADHNFDTQSQLLIEEIKQRINSLQNRGVNTMFLHDIINEVQPISRLMITQDFRIILVDYDNLEIKLSVLPKAVFLLFLRHPEGIRFKELSDYYSELLQIYLKMNPIGASNKHEQSIREITNPFSNSINEKCARIREAFVSNFDDHLAKNYYITGKRGEAKRIILDESMVIWE